MENQKTRILDLDPNLKLYDEHGHYIATLKDVAIPIVDYIIGINKDRPDVVLASSGR